MTLFLSVKEPQAYPPAYPPAQSEPVPQQPPPVVTGAPPATGAGAPQQVAILYIAVHKPIPT